MPRVLVVEDERKVLRGLERGLRTAGYEVETAVTGRDGLQLARANRFDALILDWMLPELDGIQVLTSLRATDEAVRVLLLTSRDAINDRVAGLDAGADDYLVKPFAFA
jgi:DNA-binding response OmpR family regulator